MKKQKTNLSLTNVIQVIVQHSKNKCKDRCPWFWCSGLQGRDSCLSQRLHFSGCDSAKFQQFVTSSFFTVWHLLPLRVPAISFHRGSEALCTFASCAAVEDTAVTCSVSCRDNYRRRRYALLLSSLQSHRTWPAHRPSSHMLLDGSKGAFKNSIWCLRAESSEKHRRIGTMVAWTEFERATIKDIFSKIDYDVVGPAALCRWVLTLR